MNIVWRVFLLTIFSFPVVSFAQDSLQKKQTGKKWAFLVEPYLMIPNMNGKTGVGNLPDAEVDASPGDIFSKLQFGGMLNLEVSNAKWALTTDFIYMDLKQDVKTDTLIKSGKVTSKQFVWELASLRRITPWLELGLGGILNSMKAGIDIDVNNIGGGTSHKSKDLTKTWIEPMLIARVKNAEGRKFIYQLRAEIGGFGIGSDLAWQLQAYAGYRFSKLFQMTGGYRIISVDYETGTGESRFLYDMNIFGPVIRFGFNF